MVIALYISEQEAVQRFQTCRLGVLSAENQCPDSAHDCNGSSTRRHCSTVPSHSTTTVSAPRLWQVCQLFPFLYLCYHYYLLPLLFVVTFSVSVRVQKEDVYLHPDLEFWT